MNLIQIMFMNTLSKYLYNIIIRHYYNLLVSYFFYRLEKEVVIEESKPESICDSTDSIVLPVPKMEKDEFNKNHVIECPLSK